MVALCLNLSGKDMAKAILAKDNVDVNLKNNDGTTALMFALEKDRQDVVKILLARDDVDVALQDNEGRTALMFASLKNLSKKKDLSKNADLIKILVKRQISAVGLRGDEKKAMNFLKPEDLREILKIKFSDELGEVGSAIRLERETLVLNAIHNHLKIYGTDQSWTSPNAWAASFSRVNARVNALMGEMQDIERIAGGVIVQKEIDRIIQKIMPKPQSQLTTRDHTVRANPIYQSQNEHRR
jgi:ankyrin repeat protein